jgi:hypothetical protein
LPATADGLKLVGFGTRLNPFLSHPPGESLGEERGTAASHGIAGRTVAACRPPRRGSQGLLTAPTELVVTLERVAPNHISTPEILVHYERGDRTGTATFPEGITLCPGKALGANHCAPPA